jgi:hypothetical protein
MDSLTQAYKAGTPLVIDLGGGNRRVLAGLLVTPYGLAFADVGWFDVGHQPYHFVAGKVTGSGPWSIGSAQIEELEPGDELVPQWNAWLDARDQAPAGVTVEDMLQKFMADIP